MKARVAVTKKVLAARMVGRLLRSGSQQSKALPAGIAGDFVRELDRELRARGFAFVGASGPAGDRTRCYIEGRQEGRRNVVIDRLGTAASREDNYVTLAVTYRARPV